MVTMNIVTNLMLQHGIFTLSVLTDDYDINILLPRFDARATLAVDNIDEQIQLIT